MKCLLFICSFICSAAMAQVPTDKGIIVPDLKYPESTLLRTAIDQYTIYIEKGGQYEFNIMQKGIDVMVKFIDPQGKPILEKDSPNGNDGPENFDFTASSAGKYMLQIIPFNDSTAVAKGNYAIQVKKISQQEIKRRKAIRKELAEENKKNVQTADIDHFWEAFDRLKKCKTRDDSVRAFQEIYIDRATDGFKDFIVERGFTAAEYRATVAKYPKFYNSVRANTYEVKKAVPLIDELFEKFKDILPGFKPFRVCFAIGTVRTGGTTSPNFVLIGTEITTSTKDVDLSEFAGNAMGKVLAGETDVIQKIKNIVAHECVHTQQKTRMDANAEKCNLLYTCLMEGSCDFIGELVAGKQINKVAQEYGDQHEKELWAAFSSKLCDGPGEDWLYNYFKVKDRQTLAITSATKSARLITTSILINNRRSLTSLK